MPPPSLALVVAAHPDDETIGVGALLSRLKNSVIVHTTDGAPCDVRLRSLSGSRDAYAETRRSEARRALALAGIAPDRILCLGAIDQEVALDLVRLARRLARVVERLRPRMIITHAYEGGHPDHDATAFVTHSAVALLARRGACAPLVAEMTSYHGERGHFAASTFLASSSAASFLVPGSWSVDRVLTDAERGQKAEMLACYASQRAVLTEFPIATERLRRAPAYFFDRAPHAGLLHYETLGWPMTGDAWRAFASAALGALGLEGGPL